MARMWRQEAMCWPRQSALATRSTATSQTCHRRKVKIWKSNLPVILYLTPLPLAEPGTVHTPALWIRPQSLLTRTQFYEVVQNWPINKGTLRKKLPAGLMQPPRADVARKPGTLTWEGQRRKPFSPWLGQTTDGRTEDPKLIRKRHPVSHVTRGSLVGAFYTHRKVLSKSTVCVPWKLLSFIRNAL